MWKKNFFCGERLFPNKRLFFPRLLSPFAHTLCSYHVLLSESISARSMLRLARGAMAFFSISRKSEGSQGQVEGMAEAVSRARAEMLKKKIF